MKNIFLFIAMLLLFSSTLFSQVSINTDNSAPDNSAMLDVKSTTRGALLPRMTTAERISIASPAAGLTVYDLTTQSYWYYNGTAWTTIANTPWTVNGNNIYANITGKAGIGTTLPDDKLHLYDSVNLRILIETPDNSYAGVRTRTSLREYFMGTIGDRWSVFDNYAGGDRISVLPDGNVGIATATPEPSAALDVSSTTKGFLPPRMSTEQRNGISSPVAGLVVFNTSENVLNVYNGSAWASLLPVSPFECGLSVTVNHLTSRGVAPVAKTVSYGTVSGLPGEPAKCWITQNLGAHRQATAVSDTTEASAGWYWQFNLKQGYKHDGTTLTPGTTWFNNITENSDWVASNDPCALELGAGWRLPTSSEWVNIYNAGGWYNMYDAYISKLKLHAAGFINEIDGSLNDTGSRGYYNSSNQYTNTFAELLRIAGNAALVSYYAKARGASIRCLTE